MTTQNKIITGLLVVVVIGGVVYVKTKNDTISLYVRNSTTGIQNNVIFTINYMKRKIIMTVGGTNPQEITFAEIVSGGTKGVGLAIGDYESVTFSQTTPKKIDLIITTSVGGKPLKLNSYEIYTNFHKVRNLIVPTLVAVDKTKTETKVRDF